MHQLQIEAQRMIKKLKEIAQKNKREKDDKNTAKGMHRSDNQTSQIVLSVKQLKPFIVTMLKQQREILTTSLQQKQRIVQKLREQLQKWQSLQINQASDLTSTFQKQQQNRVRMKSLEEKVEKYRKRKEGLEKEVKWNEGKMKEQLKEIEMLKLTVKKLEKIKGKEETSGKERSEKNGGTASVLRSSKAQNSLKVEVSEWSQNNKGIKDNQPQRSSAIASTKLTHNQRQNSLKTTDFDNLASKLFTIEGQKFYRHSDEDKKDRLLRQLAYKCLHLESHINLLTKKLLGRTVPSPSPRTSPCKSTQILSFRPMVAVPQAEKKDSLVIDQQLRPFSIDFD